MPQQGTAACFTLDSIPILILLRYADHGFVSEFGIEFRVCEGSPKEDEGSGSGSGKGLDFRVDYKSTMTRACLGRFELWLRFQLLMSP